MGEYLTRYAELRETSLRSSVRNWILSTAGSTAGILENWIQTLKTPRVQFLYLHYVFDDQVQAFRRLLDALGRDHQFISYTEAVQRVQHGEVDRPYITFSFDDGLKNCLQAAQLLNEYEAKACFFVCPQAVEAERYSKKKAFASRRLNLPPVDFMSWNDLEQLKREGHEIGAHTVSHPCLSELSQGKVEEEINRSAQVLRDRLGEIAHFAWPYGRFSHFNAAAARVVLDADFSSCASAERGCHVHGNVSRQNLCIRRDHIVASWSLSHTLAFLVSNILFRRRQRDEWPIDWSV